MSVASAWLSYERRLVPRLVAPFAPDIAGAIAAVPPGSLILDLAAGTGATGVAVDAAAPGSLTVAIDPDEDALAAARKAGRNAGRAVAGDAQRLPVHTGTVTVVVCQNGFQFVPDLDLACAEVGRVLQPGGRLVSLTWARLDGVCVFASLSELADSIGVGPAFREPCSLEPDRFVEGLGRAGLVVTSQRTIIKTLRMTETRGETAEFLQHWVEAADNVLIDPWRRADEATRDGWITQFADGLARRHRQLTAVLTVARL